MNTIIWFRKWGWVYVPTHFLGVAITLIAIVLLVPVFGALTTNDHSVSNDLFYLFIYSIVTTFWWRWIAHKTSK